MIEVVIISIIFGFGQAFTCEGTAKAEMNYCVVAFHKIAHMEIIDAFN